MTTSFLETWKHYRAKIAREKLCIRSLRMLDWKYSNLNKEEARLVGMAHLFLTSNYADKARRAPFQMMPMEEMVELLLQKGCPLDKQVGTDSLFACFCRHSKNLLKQGNMTEEQGLRILNLFFEHGLNLGDKAVDDMPAFWHLRESPVLFERYLHLLDTRLSKEKRNISYELQYEGHSLLFDTIIQRYSPGAEEVVLKPLEMILDSAYPKFEVDPHGRNALDWACCRMFDRIFFFSCIPLLMKKGFDPYRVGGIGHGWSPDEMIQRSIAYGSMHHMDINAYREAKVEWDKRQLEVQIPETTRTSNKPRL